MVTSAPTELLRRNADRLGHSRVLVVDAPGGDLPALPGGSAPRWTGVCLHTDRAEFQRAEAALVSFPDLEVRYGTPSDLPARAFDLVIAFLGKGREAHRMLIALAARRLDPIGRLLLVGETRAGTRTSARYLADHFQDHHLLDAARRCVLFEATGPGKDIVGGEIDDWYTGHTVTAADTSVAVSSLPGVFSHGRLDEGTRLLLETWDGPMPPAALDFGCGCGVIAAWMHAREPGIRTDMVDTSAWALCAARRTVIANGMDPECVRPSNGLSEVRGRYPLIVSNPPFHQGVKTDYGVVQRLVAEARHHLEPGGRIRLVANRFLPYHALLAGSFRACTIAAEDSRYRVYEAMTA